LPCLLLKEASITQNAAEEETAVTTEEETAGTAEEETAGSKQANHNYFQYHQILVTISLYIFYKFTIILPLSFFMAIRFSVFFPESHSI